MNTIKPRTTTELLSRARNLNNRTLGEVAHDLHIAVPSSLAKAKGWVGNLLEIALGADAGNQPTPDFTQLGIELKTLPLNKSGMPQESTYVCTMPQQLGNQCHWPQSVVCKKLSHVLWVPIEAKKEVPLAARKIQKPFLWQPNQIEFKQLQTDWEEITEYILYGEVDRLDASIGSYLHIRPKAMNSRALTWTVNAQGERIQTNPKGFYLRQQFTKYLLESYQN